MIGLLLLLISLLGLHHWLIEPFAQLFTPVLSLAWLGWASLGLALWVFAGSRRIS
jgi:hypothetical protein